MRNALQCVQENSYDVVLLDLTLPDSSGLETVTSIRHSAPDLPIVVLSGMDREDLALGALKEGAQDYLIKGQVNGQALARTILFAIERAHKPRSAPPQSVVSEVALPAKLDVPEAVNQAEAPALKALAGRSRALTDIRQIIKRIGPAESTVLITGETGTGKELVAQALHETSPRNKFPLVAVNCGSIPETLLESVLFGHNKGSFTGADRDKRGLFEAAKEGTLFLDEIGELPASLQPKILRALERREVLPVGSTSPVQFDARIVAATNRNLPAMIEKGQFRSDLYYRLNVIEIHIPALRERPEDISEIVDVLLRRLCGKMQRPVPTLQPAVRAMLEALPWPGNVREMSNILERLMLLTDGDVVKESDLRNIGIGIPSKDTDDLKLARHSFEREHILRVLGKCGGNKERAAKALGIDLSSLYRKLSD